MQRSSSLESNLEAQAAAFKAEKLNLQAAHEGFKTVKEAEVRQYLASLLERVMNPRIDGRPST